MPVCFGGLTPRKLPDPLRLLQAIDASDAKSVTKLIGDISAAARIKKRRSNCEKFVRFVQGINKQWTKGPVFPKMYEVSADIQADLPEFLRGAKEEILLCGIHFNISLANRLADYVNALAAGVGLTICAVRPDSEAVRMLAQFAGEDPDMLRSECQLTITFFDRLKQLHASRRSNSPGVGRLVLKLTDHAPNARAYLFDEERAEGLLLYTPYLRLRDSTQCPTFLFRKNHAVFGSFAESCRHHSSASDTYYDSASAVR